MKKEAKSKLLAYLSASDRGLLEVVCARLDVSLTEGVRLGIRALAERTAAADADQLLSVRLDGGAS